MTLSSGFISLSDLFIAYRKAKREAYHDTNCAHGEKFARYERHLTRNLQRLLNRLLHEDPSWPQKLEFLGRVTCIAKSVDPAEALKEHFYDGEPIKGWRQLHEARKAMADFRAVIDASVNFQIVSVLWALKVGHKFEACLDPNIALGNRLYRRRPSAAGPGEVNRDRPELFQAYFRAYSRWREEGFNAMKSELKSGNRVLGVTMDLKQFYHRIDPSFLLHSDYLEKLNVSLTKDERRFTRQLIASVGTWNHEANKQFGVAPIGVPVGLTASSIIANVLLKEFDEEVIAKLGPIHYGRYVDDVFLVLQDTGQFASKEELMRWLGKKLRRIAHYVSDGQDGPELRLRLKYAEKSAISFVGAKQKVFRLAGKLGLDLIAPIEEQIKRQGSEFRGMPWLPKTEADMAARALLVTPDASLEADSLRKADAVILRRAGFARLLSAAEKYGQDLEPAAWRDLRSNFYGLVNRQVLTPFGFFNYARYFPRIVALMSACDDIRAAIVFVRKLSRLVKVLSQTCETKISAPFTECVHTLAARLVEAVLATRTPDRRRAEALPLLREIRRILAPGIAIPLSEKRVRQSAERLFLTDWARRPYGTAWIESRIRSHRVPQVPGRTIASLLRIPAIRSLQQLAAIPVEPHWPGLCFSTRSIPLSALTAYVPRLLENYDALREISLALRGSWMPPISGLNLTRRRPGLSDYVSIPAPRLKRTFVAVTSIRTDDASWQAAALGRPDLSLSRYQRLNHLINQILQQHTRPAYVLLPECALPRRWGRSVAQKLAVNGMSLIAGLEYREFDGGLRNEALVSLVTNFGGYRTNISLLQPKIDPAWEEKRLLENLAGAKLVPPMESELCVPVYHHGGISFGILICSDLTNLQHRRALQGEIDCLFVPEWNRDVNTFSALVEASSHDMHAFVAQANNLRFGDSRIRGPHKENYKRDIVRVRGGSDDYAVTGEIVISSLRAYQSTPTPLLDDHAEFKPYPIGFKVAARRRER